MPTDYWPLIEPDYNRVSIYDGPDRFLADIRGTPDWRIHLLAVHWCNSEVCNGGFDQFFLNSTGVLAPEALRGYESVGRNDLADLLRQAMARLRPDYPRDRSARQRSLKGGLFRKKPVFNDLDDRYYELIDSPNLSDALCAYAAKHAGPA